MDISWLLIVVATFNCSPSFVTVREVAVVSGGCWLLWTVGV